MLLDAEGICLELDRECVIWPRHPYPGPIAQIHARDPYISSSLGEMIHTVPLIILDPYPKVIKSDKLCLHKATLEYVQYLFQSFSIGPDQTSFTELTRSERPAHHATITIPIRLRPLMAYC